MMNNTVIAAGTTTSKITPPLCRCGQCSPTRRLCWSCCVCGSGPFDYRRDGGGRLPFITRTVMVLGSNYGVGFDVCSELCRLELDRHGTLVVEAPPAPPPPDSTMDSALVDQFVDQLPSPEREYVMR